MTPARLGPVELTEGVLPRHALTFLYLSFIGITLNTFINFIQPYVLTEQLHIPEAQQGAMTGNLVFLSECMLLLSCAVAGVVADRVGRRMVFASGFAILAIGYACYGFVDSESQLLMLRLGLAWGVGAINVMVTLLQADYPREASRGKLVGMTGFCIGMGALFLVFVLARLPEWYGQIAVPREAGLYALLTVALIALFSAVVAWGGLSGGGDSTVKSHRRGWQQLTDAMTCARANPRIALSYACAFVARGDLIVIGVFFSLWLIQAGIANGMDTAEAVALAALYFGIIQGVALISAPVIGVLIDRLDRVTGVCITLLLAAVGYGSLTVIDDPLGPAMAPAAMLLGVGQMAVMLASQTLVAQEAPPQQRGAVMGVFSLCGALGIMFITKVGGGVFDFWKPGPFAIVAVANLLLCMAALALRRHEKKLALAIAPQSSAA
jgi:MFS family permease